MPGTTAPSHNVAHELRTSSVTFVCPFQDLVSTSSYPKGVEYIKGCQISSLPLLKGRNVSHGSVIVLGQRPARIATLSFVL